MDKADSPEQSSKLSIESMEDIEIPEAVRDTSETQLGWRWKPILFVVGGLGLAAIALMIGALLTGSNSSPSIKASSPETTPTESSPQSNPESSETEPEPTPTNSEPENLLGHLPYEQALESELQPITRDGRIRLRSAAAKSFQEMQAAARADGVILTPISGFRAVSDQQYLFFDIKEQRGQGPTERAEVSAPPGYSEHHTGYAVDIGDGRVPGTNLSTSFENTAAFKWLQQNAARYSFELSFPRDNFQGISYEPWHWRFVGDRDSLETFYKARNLNSPIDQRRNR